MINDCCPHCYHKGEWDMDDKRCWTIKVSKGQEYRAHEESIYEEGLFFSDVYQQTRAHLNEILSTAEQLTQQAEAERKLGAGAGQLFLSNAPNNVIAFCAERGQGKSSAMRSAAKALRELDRIESEGKKAQKRDDFWGDCAAKKYTYEVLDSIDPTRMAAGDNIVKIVLYRMFMRFKKVWEDRVKYEDRIENKPGNWEMDRKRDELLEQFHSCWHSLEVLQGETTDDISLESELERLEERGDSSNLRGELYRLIDSYLGFLHPGESAVLLLQIDDADLNIERVYDLLEDARKYLFLPNVVIIMAANITQLESTLEQHFLREYRESLRYEESMVDVYRCHEIAERYLEKVVPTSRRIYLPDLNQTLREGHVRLRIEYLGEVKQDLIGDRYAGEQEDWDYQNQLLYFLHRKTGLVYVRPSEGSHGLLPDNMRDLTHFLAYFSALPDVDMGYFDLIDIFARKSSPQEGLARWQQNLRLLEHYLVDLWSANNLQDRSRRLLREFAHQEQNSNKHRYLLSALPDLYSNGQKGANLAQKDLRALRDAFVAECRTVGVRIPAHYIGGAGKELPYATYADAFTALDVLTTMRSREDHSKFACAVRLQYSICLHQMLLQHMQTFADDESGGLPFVVPETSLTAFIGDGFFRGGPQGNCKAPLAFWYLRVEPGTVAKWGKKQSDIGQQEMSAIRQCVRKEIDDGYTKSTVPLAGWSDLPADAALIFNVQYVWLHQIDMLYLDRENRETYEKYATEEGLRQNMYQTLVFVLNPDVQHRLYFTEKRGKVPAEDDRLSQIVTRWFRDASVWAAQWLAMDQNNLDSCLGEGEFQWVKGKEVGAVLDDIRPHKPHKKEGEMSKQKEALEEQKAQTDKDPAQPEKAEEQESAPLDGMDQQNKFTTDEGDPL